MFGYGLAGDVEVLRNGVGDHGLHGDQDEDCSSGGVGNSLTNISSLNAKIRSQSIANIHANDWLRIFLMGEFVSTARLVYGQLILTISEFLSTFVNEVDECNMQLEKET